MDVHVANWLALPVLGFVVGALVGATGVGAGSMTTPALVLGFGVHPVIAVGTDLLFAAVTKSAGAVRHHKLGSIDARVLGWLAAGSLPAAAITLLALWILSVDKTALAPLIKSALGAVLLMTAVALLLKPCLSFSFNARSEPPQPAPWFRLTAIGAVLGGLVALTSIGAGSLGVVALAAAAPALTTRHIIGTDIAHAIPLTLLCGLGHLAMGNMDFRLLGLLLLGSLPGVWLGSHYSARLSEPILRVFLALVLLLAAAMLLRR